MNEEMKDSKQSPLLEIVKKAAVDNRLTCGKAHKLAEETGYTLDEIGLACEEMKIKIKNCQLGCF